MLDLADETVCAGCGSAIYDPFIMHVQPDMKWHGRCLKCHKCDRELSEEISCFVHNGRAYCREDYCNSFLQRCAGCHQLITKVDLVLRIRGQTFHVGCFRCAVCQNILQPGEEIAYRRNLPLCLRDARLYPLKEVSSPTPNGTEASEDAPFPTIWAPKPRVREDAGADLVVEQTSCSLRLGGLSVGEVIEDQLRLPPISQSDAKDTPSKNAIPVFGPVSDDGDDISAVTEGAGELKVLTLLSSGPNSCREGSQTEGPAEVNETRPKQTLLSEPGEFGYPSPQRTRTSSTSSSFDGPNADKDGPNTPSSEISQEDECSSLLGCMTSALSCMSGGLPTGDGSIGGCLAMGDESRKGLDSGDGSVSVQSSTGALNQVRSCTDSDGANRNKSGVGGGKRTKEQKTTRVRTVLNEKQLHMLRTCYAANPRPDALMKEQLVEMTGLSPRVIRVWFQNKRCKDKKKQIMIKQMEQHHQNGLISCGLQGVPMVAGSPVPNDASMLCPSSSIDVQRLPGPMCWKPNSSGETASPQSRSTKSSFNGVEGGSPPYGGGSSGGSSTFTNIGPPPSPSGPPNRLLPTVKIPPRFSPLEPSGPPPALATGYANAPAPHLFPGLLPPVPPLVDSKTCTSPLPLGETDTNFPAFQQLMSNFDLMEPMLNYPRVFPVEECSLTSLSNSMASRRPSFSPKNRIPGGGGGVNSGSFGDSYNSCFLPGGSTLYPGMRNDVPVTLLSSNSPLSATTDSVASPFVLTGDSALPILRPINLRPSLST
ncbi:Insulin protein enhancer protein isl-1 [Sparganum proliferum]